MCNFNNLSYYLYYLPFIAVTGEADWSAVTGEADWSVVMYILLVVRVEDIAMVA